MIDVSKKMHELIELTKNGFNGIMIPLKPECKEEWNSKYAIVYGFYFDEPIEFHDIQSKYIEVNTHAIQDDFENLLKDHFSVDKIYRESSSDKKPPNKGELVVRCYYQSQEIEVYYQ